MGRSRIEAEVLSVVSSQIQTIQDALKAGSPRFLFEGERRFPQTNTWVALCAHTKVSQDSESRRPYFVQHHA